MDKIIQICAAGEDLYCLTIDGKVYIRQEKYQQNYDKKEWEITSSWKEIEKNSFMTKPFST